MGRKDVYHWDGAKERALSSDDIGCLGFLLVNMFWIFGALIVGSLILSLISDCGESSGDRVKRLAVEKANAAK